MAMLSFDLLSIEYLSHRISAAAFRECQNEKLETGINFMIFLFKSS